MTAALLSVPLAWAVPCRAVLDVENRGPTLAAGAFAMRVTNIGSLGNPFYDEGRSFDPSFEFPRGSGNEGLKHADLWVGARVPSLGAYRVSGGPLLEWRPTLDPEDRVRTAYGGQFGAQPFVDDDGDGRVDEEALNGKDDDGDGEADEDLGVSASQELYAEYTDDQPEAVAYGYEGGEAHVPMHLEVKQQAFTWAVPGYDRIAGVRFTVTNHGNEALEDVRMGLLADLDSRGPGEAGGHMNDLIRTVHYENPYNDGVASVPSFNAGYYGDERPTPYSKQCLGVLSGDWPVVYDSANPALPAFGLVPLRHSTDVLAVLRKSRLVDNSVDSRITGLADVNFHYSIFAMDLPPTEGGPPALDADRYAALAGTWPGPRNLTVPHDWAVLISCGPFPVLEPGQSYSFDMALVCGASPDSVAASMGLAAVTERGSWVNLKPDTLGTLIGQLTAGKSGFTGHETCYEPPAGLAVVMDPHCYQKYPQHGQYENTPDYTITLPHGTCTWIDADCEVCTGFNGNETRAAWADPASVPPSPAYRAVPGDHEVTVEWDNSPELLVKAPRSGATAAPVTFKGYNVYRLSDWRRYQLLPGPEKFQLIATFGLDTLNGEKPLASVTDTSLDWAQITFGGKQYPIGRYRFTDRRALNGFDYLYVVTTVGERAVKLTPTLTVMQRFESPIVSSIDSMTTPRAPAADASGGVWVVPNPFRAHVEWDRPPVAGDTFGRHVDFMGLPRARSTIRVYTVAGDLVWQADHDGSGGDGEARWNLISRNGQDVESGIYLFTVESDLGHQVGRFVVIR
jgi:hypothetical protein